MVVFGVYSSGNSDGGGGVVLIEKCHNVNIILCSQRDNQAHAELQEINRYGVIAGGLWANAKW